MIRDPSRAFVGATVFTVAVVGFSRIPLLPDIGRDLSLTVGQIGLLTTAFGVGRLAMDLPAGHITGAFGSVRGLAAAGTLLALSCAVFAASDSFAVAVAASAVTGAASALTNTIGMVAFASVTDISRRGASVAIYSSALMSGQMIGPVLGGAVGGLAGWRVAVALSAVAGLGVALACAIWSALDRGRVAPDPRVAAVADGPYRHEAGARHSGELLALAMAPFAIFFGVAGLSQTLIPLIGDAELGLSASTIGLAIGGGGAMRFASAWLAGVASDRFSRRLVLVPCLATGALAALALAYPGGGSGWVASILLLAIGSSGISVAAAGVADRVPPERLGRELGRFRFLGDLGLIVGPMTAGFAYQASGPTAAALICAVLFGAATLAAAVWVE